MIVIADSGSTKADWVLMSPDGGRQLVQSMGFNPFYHPSRMIAANVSLKFDSENIDRREVSKVYYYGAGCSDDYRCGIVSIGLSSAFPNAVVEVEHDLLAAARALCGHDPGIACIIGTGSNSALYDGQHVVDNVTNLGFLLGDEGSGSHLGKKLVRAYFYRELPKDLEQAFSEIYPQGKRGILNEIYKGEGANVYLAGFAKFLGGHQRHPYVRALVYDAFAEFVDRHVMKYEGASELPVHFVGSIAYHFGETLKAVLADRNLSLGKLLHKPIEHLADFHMTMAMDKNLS